MAISSIHSNPDQSRLDALRDRLNKFGIGIAEPFEAGGYSIYWPGRIRTSSRHFDTLDEIEAWVRQHLADLLRNDARDVMTGVAEIVRLFDDNGVQDEAALVNAVHRLIEAGLGDLEHLEMLEMDLRGESAR